MKGLKQLGSTSVHPMVLPSVKTAPALSGPSSSWHGKEDGEMSDATSGALGDSRLAQDMIEKFLLPFDGDSLLTRELGFQWDDAFVMYTWVCFCLYLFSS